MSHPVGKLLFVALNGRVAALDAESGAIAWSWMAPSKFGSTRYCSLLLLPNPARLVVSVSGYIYCLEPASGQLLWSNEMTGFGIGVTSLAAAGASDPNSIVAGAAEAAADR